MQFKVFWKLLPLYKNPLPLFKEVGLEEKQNDSDFSVEFPRLLQKQCPGFDAELIKPKLFPGQHEPFEDTRGENS